MRPAGDWFALRSAFQDALARLGRLMKDGEGAGVNPAQRVLIDNLGARLDDPCRIVVTGGTGAGKSMFLDALFDGKITGLDSEVRLRRGAGGAVVIRHGRRARDERCSDSLVELTRPADCLRGFELVEAGDWDGEGPGPGDAVVRRFLAGADVVVVLVASNAPWSARVLEFLESLGESDWEKCVLVVSKAELRETTEVSAVIEHLGLVARRRLGREPAVFALSCKQALRARTGALHNEELFALSGFAGVEAWISEKLNTAPRRITALESVADSVDGVIAQLRGKHEAAGRWLLNEDEVRAVLTSSRQAFAADVRERVGPRVEELEQACDDLRDHCGADLHARLSGRRGIAATLRPRRFAAQVESKLLKGVCRRLDEAESAAWESIAIELENSRIGVRTDVTALLKGSPLADFRFVDSPDDLARHGAGRTEGGAVADGNEAEDVTGAGDDGDQKCSDLAGPGAMCSDAGGLLEGMGIGDLLRDALEGGRRMMGGAVLLVMVGASLVAWAVFQSHGPGHPSGLLGCVMALAGAAALLTMVFRGMKAPTEVVPDRMDGLRAGVKELFNDWVGARVAEEEEAWMPEMSRLFDAFERENEAHRERGARLDRETGLWSELRNQIPKPAGSPLDTGAPRN